TALTSRYGGSVTANWQHALHQADGLAVDHVDALRALVQDAKQVHARAPFTLLRATLENAAAAVWLLAPNDRAERLLRRLRLQWADALDQVNVQNLRNMTALLTKDEWKAELRQAAVDAGLNPAQVIQVTAGKITYRSIVETAGEALAKLTGKDALLCWMISSGIAHAQSWAVLSVLKRVETPGASPDVVTVEFSAPEMELVLVSQVTMLMLIEAWRLFDQRRMA
ncbi:hypothetical protein ACFQ1S_06920, partial [Kibdelosporangium lantanae]